MKRFLIVLGFILAPALAYAGGLYENFPLVGATSPTCVGFINGTCREFAPVGPSQLSGLETVPADTALANGAAPQTVRVPVVLFGAGGIQNDSPLTGTSVTVASGISHEIITPAGTIAALTLVLPALSTGLVNGQTLSVSSSQTVTALTLTPGAGTTVVGAATTVGAAAPFDLIYYNTVWYRK